MRKFFERWEEYFAGLVLLIAGGIGGDALQGILTNEFLKSKEIAFLAAAVIAIVGVFILLRLSRKIDKLDQKLDITFDYFPMEKGFRCDDLFKESERIIRSATTEILALNSYAEERPHPAELDKQPRISYFQALEEMSSLPNMKYKRVLQLENEEKVAEYFHPSYVNHFLKILEERDRSINDMNLEKEIELKLIRPKFPSTFVIVDNQYLLWQLNEIDPENKYIDTHQNKRTPKKERIRMRGVVVINDPQKRFIKHFKDTFLRAYRQPGRSVEDSDLV